MDDHLEPAADYSYWLHVRVWSADEAAALFIGYEPEYTRYTIDGVFDVGSEDRTRSAISKQAKRLEKILESAQLAGEFGEVELNQIGKPWGKTVTWREWIAWAPQNNIPLNATLSRAIDDHNKRVQIAESSAKIDPRRESTLLRTIGALLHILKQESSHSEADVIRQINDLFGHIPGIAKSTMERDFAGAKRRLTDY